MIAADAGAVVAEELRFLRGCSVAVRSISMKTAPLPGALLVLRKTPLLETHVLEPRDLGVVLLGTVLLREARTALVGHLRLQLLEGIHLRRDGRGGDHPPCELV